MNKILVAILFFNCLIFSDIYSQSNICSEHNYLFYQKVNIEKYAGKQFKIEAKIKVDTTNADGLAILFAMMDKIYKTFGFYYYSCIGCQNAIKTNEWKTYTISGVIDNSVDSLIIGGQYRMNGKFYFDDFNLKIEESKNEWKQINLVNNSFDNSIIDSLSRMPFGWHLTAYDEVKMSFQNVLYDNNYSVKVESSPENKNYLAIVGSFLSKLGSNKTVGKYVSVNGIKIYYETYGKGEPLLLLHGNGQSIIDFENQIPVFSKEFKVIAVDSRAQGKSTDSKQEISYDLMANDMNVLLDSLHLDSVNIIGWSDGGNTGLIMAMKYPKKVKKLIVMGANLYPDTSAINIKDLKWAKRTKVLLSIMGVFNKRARHDKKLINMLLKYPNINPTDLADIKIPTLVLAGEHDIIKEEHTKLIAHSFPKAQLVIFPNSTHFIPQENPTLFNKTVLNFLLDN